MEWMDSVWIAGGQWRYRLLYVEDSKPCIHTEDDNTEVECGSVQPNLC